MLAGEASGGPGRVHVGTRYPCKSFINGDHLYEFVNGFPNLHQLDLLGKGIRDVKLQMAEALMRICGGQGRQLGW